MFWAGLTIGVLLLPAGFVVLTGVQRLRRGRWTELDRRECDACRVPDDQWSPIHRCPRCGARQIRSWLYRLAGRAVLERQIERGPRDEAWLNGEVDA